MVGSYECGENGGVRQECPYHPPVIPVFTGIHPSNPPVIPLSFPRIIPPASPRIIPPSCPRIISPSFP